MITIKDETKIELTKCIARCNFCGNKNTACVQGTVNLEVEYTNYETKSELVVTLYDTKAVVRGDIDRVICGDIDRVIPSFKKSYYKINDYQYERVINTGQYKEVVQSKIPTIDTDSADICFDCIKELAKLIK